MGAARDQSGLYVGMSLDAVRNALQGWREHPKLVAKSTPNIYHVWDFIPPEGSGETPIRLTFFSDDLVLWGEPAPIRHGPIDGDSGECGRGSESQRETEGQPAQQNVCGA